jgi:hypothetical protein
MSDDKDRVTVQEDPNGYIVLSTRYRYMSETAPYLDDLNKTKVILRNAPIITIHYL